SIVEGFGEGAVKRKEEGRKMGKGQYAILVVVALVAGLLGGVGASWVLTNRLTSAQTAKIIQAERVEIVDKDGKVQAILGTDDIGVPSLELHYDGAKVMLSSSGLEVAVRKTSTLQLGPFGLEVADNNGKTRFALTLRDPLVPCGPCL